MIAGSNGSSFFNFLRCLHPVSMVAEPMYSLQPHHQREQGFLRCTSPLARVSFCLLEDCQLNRCEVVLIPMCISPMICAVEYLFIYLMSIWMSSLDESTTFQNRRQLMEMEHLADIESSCLSSLIFSKYELRNRIYITLWGLGPWENTVS